MRLNLNSKVWNKIYYGLSNDYDRTLGRKSIEDWFKDKHKIIINTDHEGRWISVDINEDQLTILLLKAGDTYNDID